jgi:hypothetical protein
LPVTDRVNVCSIQMHGHHHAIIQSAGDSCLARSTSRS